jgi:hypothetical protein
MMPFLKQPALNEERLKSIIIDEAYRTTKVRDGNRINRTGSWIPRTH